MHHGRGGYFGVPLSVCVLDVGAFGLLLNIFRAFSFSIERADYSGWREGRQVGKTGKPPIPSRPQKDRQALAKGFTPSIH